MTVFWLVVSAAVLAGLVTWFRRYPSHPGTIRFTFGWGPEERAARAELRAVRRDCEERTRVAHQAVAEAEREVADRDRPLEERVRELREYRTELGREVRGEQVGDVLWPLRLHEHALLFLKQEATEGDEPQGAVAGDEPRVAVAAELPLEGLTVERDTSLQDVICIRVVRADGRQLSARYSRTPHNEVAVDDFLERVHNQLLEDRDDRTDRRSRDARAAAEIERIEAERAGIKDAGRPHLEKVEQNRRAELARAEADFGTARDNWEKKTGRRPWR
ncbi:hypothetical protein [Streptomyces sp. CA-210063]|uniref:hypothetical protein n=1 Tax=Streptomyces sp. CA-210063 TaxID=2801029 RepID=UPI0027D47E32|nr:hypothetical protein [Streptomyces sp. CA-210063]